MTFDPENPESFLHAKQTIVIVDDEFTTRSILRETVLGIGEKVVVESFSNPLQAVGWLSVNDADLILLDYKMKEMSGYEVLQALQDIPHLEDVPIVVVTAESDKDIRYKMLSPRGQ